MKFENIKKGDTAFIQKDIKYGWHSSESFFIPKEVTKVTATQFTLSDGNRYRIKDGKCIGGRYAERAYKEGEEIGWANNTTIVSDQSNDMKAFQHKLNLGRSVQKKIESIKIRIDISTEDLEKIEKYADEIQKLTSNE